PEVLAWLERRDRQHVIAVRRIALRLKGLGNSVWNHANLLLGDVEQLEEFAARELGDGDQPPRSLRHPRQRLPAVRSCPAVEGLRMAEHREVVKRDDKWHSRAKRSPVRGAVENVHPV